MYIPAVVLLIGVSLAHGVSFQTLVEEQWHNFKLEHGKFYQTEDEEDYRRQVFMDNLHKINEHNKNYELGITTYKMAMNHMGDLTSDEFLRYYTSEMPQLDEYMENLNNSETITYGDDDFIIYEPQVEVNVEDLPRDVDWSKHGAVTGVKNQGQCGSCWSFSATGALEAAWYRKHGHLISLSEQNLVDCSWKYGNHGCKGGWMHWAYNYIKANGGIDTEQAYPYHAHNQACHYNPRSRGATVAAVVQFKGEGALQQKVASVGPIAIAAEVGHNFHFYHSGVYYEPHCGHSLNHAMLVVGYGNNYWLVKNSWGTGWGDRGYIRMARNRNNNCGIADAPTYPIV
ncbi:unnamed protein product [Ceutorhynchus assimilis]|uniref:Uncharacterized protein n=1 Tax=Ceutorhynchus assimilis TaxID=467358 RepID=A0A9N9QLX6_9CUCU|nr:unnamed protein product [Ceutorhynchus assimilis]